MRRRLAVLALIWSLLASAGTAAAAPRAPLDHEGRWITDASGRVVILHGWNMVYKVGSYRPEDAGFGRDDVRFLVRNGFNTVRLGVIQNGFEPRLPGPGGKPRYRDGYLRSIARTERLLARHGVFTLLDVHQDMFNERFEGEGFPDWAVLGDAATLPAEPKQGFPRNYQAMAALNRAYDYLWANDSDAAGRPLQASFAAMWKRIATRFENRRHVLGYNILNEPWPGSQWPGCASNAGCPAFDTQFLEPFTERVIAAIRKVDERKLVWYAPLLLFDFGADTSHGDTGDPNAGFAFNMYCLGDVFGEATGDLSPVCETGYGLTLDNAEQQSEETGDALLMTEFAATDDLEKVETVLDLADERMIGWQQWHYCDCRDPTTTGTGVQSLVSNPKRPPHAKGNLNRGKLRVSSRPYPRAVNGTPLRYGFDRASRRFHLTYSTRGPDGRRRARALPTEVFIPPIHYRRGYRYEARGAGVVSRPGARVLKLRAAKRAKRVRLVVRPG